MILTPIIVNHEFKYWHIIISSTVYTILSILLLKDVVYFMSFITQQSKILNLDNNNYI